MQDCRFFIYSFFWYSFSRICYCIYVHTLKKILNMQMSDTKTEQTIQDTKLAGYIVSIMHKWYTERINTQHKVSVLWNNVSVYITECTELIGKSWLGSFLKEFSPGGHWGSDDVFLIKVYRLCSQSEVHTGETAGKRTCLGWRRLGSWRNLSGCRIRSGSEWLRTDEWARLLNT